MFTDESHDLLTVPTGNLRIPEAPPVTAGDNVSESPDDRAVYFSLVIPTFNEAKNIRKIVELLTKLLDGFIADDYELIVVDDNSPDCTWELAQALMSEYPQLRVMRRQEEKGLSTAVIRGWQAAKGQVLGVIDADLQHPPEVLQQLLAAIEQGADLATASRHVEGGGVSEWSVVRRFLSRGAQLLGLVILPRVIGRVSDPMSGYFMVRRSAIANRTMNPMGYKILIEVIGVGNIDQVAEVGYVFQERQEGESKVTWRQYVEYILHLLRLRSGGRVARLRKRWQPPVARFMRFGVVGLSGVGVDLGIFYLLREFAGLALTRSAILSSEVAIITNFLLNDAWTFGDISSKQKGWKRRIKRFIKFNIICLMGLILNVLLVNLLFNAFGMNEYLAKLIAIAAVTLWNFWINLKLSWRVTETK
ncbi:MAG: glycosyltransferase [Scytolyngbya sp. HA4215-MV1]|jgi:dolichol-phosphate mannosyltransferase|nr:glycosyltransferase [Scytolyngbya sp. HA4215-MV1]